MVERGGGGKKFLGFFSGILGTQTPRRAELIRALGDRPKALSEVISNIESLFSLAGKIQHV